MSKFFCSILLIFTIAWVANCYVLSLPLFFLFSLVYICMCACTQSLFFSTSGQITACTYAYIERREKNTKTKTEKKWYSIVDVCDITVTISAWFLCYSSSAHWSLLFYFLIVDTFDIMYEETPSDINIGSLFFVDSTLSRL